MRDRKDAVVPTPGIAGQVAVWGKVIAHALGYRAEFAHPVRLWLGPLPMAGFPFPAAMQEELQEITRNYGCDVRLGWPEADGGPVRAQ